MALGAGRVIAQYRDPGLRAQAYLRIRWAICPFDRILPLVPARGRLLDVGCGSGLWLTYLALERPALELHGIDTDARKLDVASTSLAGKAQLRQTSAIDLPKDQFDCITILDVFYLLSDSAKGELLRACRRALRPGGTVVLKDADTRPRWKYAPTAIEEMIAVHVMRITQGRPHFQSMEQLARGLDAAGFTDVETARIDRGYLHPHVVLRARKVGA